MPSKRRSSPKSNCRDDGAESFLSAALQSRMRSCLPRPGAAHGTRRIVESIRMHGSTNMILLNRRSGNGRGWSRQIIWHIWSWTAASVQAISAMARQATMAIRTFLFCLNSLYLLPPYQHMGLGRRIFAQVRQAARERKLDSFFCGCNVHNLPARRFYEKMGGVVGEIDDGHENLAERPDVF